MKRRRIAHSLHSLMTAGLMLVLLAASSLAGPSSSSRARAAEILVSGAASEGEKPFLKLNGEPVLSGRTFFSYSTLETPHGVSATINLPGLGRVSLAPGTMLSLGFSDQSIAGELHAGMIRVSSTPGTAVSIRTPDDRLENDPSSAVSFTLDLNSGVSKAVVESGIARLNNGVPAQTQTSTGAGTGVLLGLIVFGAAVGTAVYFGLINRVDDDDRASDVIISPIR